MSEQLFANSLFKWASLMALLSLCNSSSGWATAVETNQKRIPSLRKRREAIQKLYKVSSAHVHPHKHTSAANSVLINSADGGAHFLECGQSIIAVLFKIK